MKINREVGKWEAPDRNKVPYVSLWFLYDFDTSIKVEIKIFPSRTSVIVSNYYRRESTVEFRDYHRFLDIGLAMEKICEKYNMTMSERQIKGVVADYKYELSRR